MRQLLQSLLHHPHLKEEVEIFCDRYSTYCDHWAVVLLLWIIYRVHSLFILSNGISETYQQYLFSSLSFPNTCIWSKDWFKGEKKPAIAIFSEHSCIYLKIVKPAIAPAASITEFAASWKLSSPSIRPGIGDFYFIVLHFPRTPTIRHERKHSFNLCHNK